MRYEPLIPLEKRDRAEPEVRIGIGSARVRLSQRSVPHFIVEVDGYEYSVCYFSKRDGPLYRVWYWEPHRDGEQTRLLDIPLVPGQEVDLVKMIRDEVVKQYV